MTGEGAKVIDLLTDLVGHPREATTPDTDVRLLGIDLAYVVTHGCHPVEAMGVQEVVHLLNTGVAPEPLPSRAEPLGLVRTVGGVLPPRRLSPRRENRPRSPLPSWRSKSPYSEGRSRDVSRGRSSPRRIRDVSPGIQDLRPTRRNTPPKAPTGERSIRALSPRTQSPSRPLPRRDLPTDLNRGRYFSQSRPVSPAHAARPESSTTSKRSSPATGPDRGGLTPRKSRSRSPTRSSPPPRPSGLSGSPHAYRDRDSMRNPEAVHSDRGPSNADHPESHPLEPVQSRSGSYVPTQPRNLGVRQSPPSGPSHGPKAIPSQPRGSHTDFSHLASIFVLLQKMKSTSSCSGLSFKSQVLYLLVFVTRYLDLFWTFFDSLYLTTFKLLFIGSSGYIIYLMLNDYKPTHDPNIDTFKVQYLLGISAILAVLFPHDYRFSEILWTFSIWLESVAILPQLFMLQRTGEADTITTHYLFALGLYRALYIPNWVYRYFTEVHFQRSFQPVPIIAGIIQTLLYSDFFYIYYNK
ncbi:uncharacterized protein N7484_008751 [Penicillium longicatenatum]|uniref:uncharacterized protein n=1 Tax=Penicillium longicatenatum TaxID=1561947 RepID=UPI002549B95E|nr:uncharacterized protein N7484_008751 [Penicillium longicatenatum]KAJ5635438.1 hypothetical protein N7484_008751 [Penicillium longicatenatum]